MRGQIRSRHDSGVVDESVNWFRITIDFLGGLTHLLLRAEVKFKKAGGDAWRGGFEDILRRLNLGQIAAGEDDEAGSMTGYLESDFGTDTTLRDASD